MKKQQHSRVDRRLRGNKASSVDPASPSLTHRRISVLFDSFTARRDDSKEQHQTSWTPEHRTGAACLVFNISDHHHHHYQQLRGRGEEEQRVKAAAGGSEFGSLLLQEVECLQEQSIMGGGG